MPRLTGYRERRYGNLYDGVNLMDMLNGERLFGNRNVGYREMTNLQVAGQLAYDASFVILNVYVRTNVCRSPISREAKEVARDAFLEGNDDLAVDVLLKEHRFERSPVTKMFDEWAHQCTLELIIGQRPCFLMNVYDLFGGPAFGPRNVDLDEDKDNDSKSKRKPWRQQLAMPFIVPVRQNICVQLSHRIPDALKHALEARDVQPAPRLWVHLEGLETRDIQ